MLAVEAREQKPVLVEVDRPVPARDEVLVAVRAAALNRADLLQLRGLYPPPPGESRIPGLECAGEIVELGPGVKDWCIGQRVMALLAGGGQAEKVIVPIGQLMPIPENLDFVEAAALPEAGLTAWTNLVAEGRLRAGETVLIVAAASGIGTFAVQVARELGARVLVAGRDLERLEILRPLGADACFRLDESLPEMLRATTHGRGVDLILDMAGGPAFGSRLKALASSGRCVLVGLLAGNASEIDLADMLRRRLAVVGSVLRARSRAEKATLVREFRDFAEPRLTDGRWRPFIDRVLPFAAVAAAYAQLEQGGVLGKIVLTIP